MTLPGRTRLPEQYAIWTTDNNGNYIGLAFGVVSGTDPNLKSIETVFQQDLNGDGTIGLPASPGTTIKSFGVTKLVQSGNIFNLNPVAGRHGPDNKVAASSVFHRQPGWKLCCHWGRENGQRL